MNMGVKHKDQVDNNIWKGLTATSDDVSLMMSDYQGTI